jgi:hypothetical protein
MAETGSCHLDQELTLARPFYLQFDHLPLSRLVE